MTEDLILPASTELTAPGSGVDEKEVPCEFHFRSGKIFVVPKVAAWCYIPQGIFATGHFKGYSGEIHIIINADELEYHVLDFDALAKFNEREASE